MSRDAHLHPEGAYQCPGVIFTSGSCVFVAGSAYSHLGRRIRVREVHICVRGVHISPGDDVLVSRGCILVSICTQNRSIACLAVCTCVRACVRVSVRADTCVFVDIWCAYVCCAVDSGSIRKESV